MSPRQTRDVSETSILWTTEEELAELRRTQGKSIVFHQGRYWEKKAFGFFNPIHRMARLSLEEAQSPTPLCWGWRAALKDSDRHAANATMPVYLVSDLANYTLEALNLKQRNNIRRCRKQVEMVEILQPDLLLEQGYHVVCSAHRRTGFDRLPSLNQYRKQIEELFSPRRMVILGGLVEGRLGGYTLNFAIGETAYGDRAYFATEALRSNIAAGLEFEWLQICRRTAAIREVFLGVHYRENQGLCRFKEAMNFPVRHIPARAWFAPGVQTLIQKLYPHIYYRLTGHE